MIPFFIRFTSPAKTFWVLLLIASIHLSAYEMEPQIAKWLSRLPDKHPLDKSEYRKLTLDNGIKVLLLSDPKLNKSSASMAVEVGSLSDPRDIQGMAHFLEHMLFLGTEKYPEVDDYGAYLKNNGGYSNAYTSRTLTNYHFEVYPLAMEGALDRFSQFFVAPLFSEKYTEREMNAVESEFQKNLKNDGWRALQVKRGMYNPEHPENHFSIGNLSTLSHITRDQLLEFYNKYYTADRMCLSLVSPDSLNELEIWAKKYFGSILQKETAEPIEIPPNYMDLEEGVRISWVVPVQDIRSLLLEFSLPSIHKHYESKPMDLIAFAIGDEGPGSLLSLLKKRGLATGLGAYSHDETGVYGRLMVDISLTPKGLEQYEQVIEYFYSYIKMLKTEGYNSGLYKELAIQGRLNEVYNDKGEGANRAVFLANQLTQFPLEIAEREPYLFTKEDPMVYESFLDYLIPDNMLVVISAKNIETEFTEPYYGTEYRTELHKGDFFTRLKNPNLNKSLFFPPVNPFIPEEVQIEPERVAKILDEEGIELFYSQDMEFQRPKVTMIFEIKQPESLQSSNNEVLKTFYSSCVQEALNEIAYPASIAGLNYSFVADTHKTQLTISGYNESSISLLRKILEQMITFELPENQFKGIKDKIVRNLENFNLQDAWKITRLLKNQMVEYDLYNPAELIEYAQKITQKEVQKFAKKLLSKGSIKALIHGNMSDVEAIRSVKELKNKLKMKTLPERSISEQKYLLHESPEQIVRVEKLKVNNSCFWREFELGKDDPQQRAASLIFNNFIKQPFYTIMRTKKQLGYIVWSGTSIKNRNLFSYFIIQSATHSADELQEHVDSFMVDLPNLFEELDASAFEKLRAGAIALMNEKPKSIAEKASSYFRTISRYDGDFNRKNENIRELKKITKEEVLKLLKVWFSSETATFRTTLSFAENHTPKDSTIPTFREIEKWKKSREFN